MKTRKFTLNSNHKKLSTEIKISQLFLHTYDFMFDCNLDFFSFTFHNLCSTYPSSSAVSI